MSWQATAWAERQKTGSPASKVLLLVLANYADEYGRCWPSQATLADGTEQSLDTVQRQLRRLQAGGHIAIEPRARKGGHWPGSAYQLNMPGRKRTGPQSAARSDDNTPARKDAAEAKSSGSLRPGRAATSTSTGPQALRHEYLRISKENNQAQNDPPCSVDAPKAARRKRAEAQDLQRRVVCKLGNGNDEQGWNLFGSLTVHQRKTLENLEADGLLDRSEIDAVLLSTRATA